MKNMIRIYDNFDKYSEEEYTTIFQSFPDILKTKVRNRVGEDRKKMCIAEYFSLKQMLGCENLDDLKLSENGKPYIENEKFFNISNSEDLFCIAVSDVPVGVDIQKIIRYDQKLAKRICSESEFDSLNEVKDKDLELTKLWTKKEAFIKCRGETIGQDLKGLLEDTKGYDFQFSTHGDFVICECKKTL